MLIALLCFITLSTPALAFGDDTAGSHILFDFETGNMQGWKIVEKEFGETISDGAFYEPLNMDPAQHGDYFLTTLEGGHDPQTGVMESPPFTVDRPYLSLLVGGGQHEQTYVALCTEDGDEVRHARGVNSATMRTATWDVSDLMGQKVFLRVVDRHTESWGHVTVDYVRLAQQDLGAIQRAEKLREIRKRMSDPTLRAPGSPRIYRDEALTAISLPVGGIGAGPIQINGYGELAVWQIFNRFERIRPAGSFFAIRARAEGSEPVVRAVQGKSIGPFGAMENVTFRGEYPFGWYSFSDPQLPVSVEMEVFNPLIPLNAKDSAIPCAIFRFSARNVSSVPVTVSFLGSLENVCGFTALAPKMPDGEIFADFEDGSYGQWKAVGNAFGDKPATGEYGIQTLSGFRGSGLVNTYRDTDELTGTLTSEEFTINHKYINFLIGGGKHPDKTCINLLVDGKVVRTATGNNSDRMQLHVWDVGDLAGKAARIEIVDKVQGGWGHIDIDHIVMTDTKPKKNALEFVTDASRTNEMTTAEGMTMLHATTEAATDTAGYGDMALAVMRDNAPGTARYSNMKALRGDIIDDVESEGESSAEAAASEPAPRGAIAAPLKLTPGETRTASFVLTWHFPNADHGTRGWGGNRNMYTNWWPDAAAVARYVTDNYSRLRVPTLLYHDSIYASNLPHWLLDRITSQLAVLSAKTCFWTENGYFGAYEGCRRGGGCCFGNCNHVWQYAQAHARLFPSVARRMREQSLSFQRDDGSLPMRQPKHGIATDGQFGEILAAYREHLMTADNSWLHEHWPQIRKAMEFAIQRWDADEDGVLAGPQHNTLDGELGGSTSWLGTMYLAALAASENIAKIEGDDDLAVRYSRIRSSGAQKQNKTLWNGEYYIQIPDPEPRRDYNTGCSIDQVLGQWWARQLNLGWLYPPDRVRKALRSLVKYNFQPDFHGIVQSPRKFIPDDEAGMQMITWPRGNRPANHIRYADEVMSGFEYSAAGAMMQADLIERALLVLRAAYERYDGERKTDVSESGAWGYTGNPFGDDECGKLYARPMSIWSVLLAAQGYVYNGPKKIIGFRPIWRPENHASFFTAANGWGVFRQIRAGDTQTDMIELRYGKLQVRQLVFELPEDREIQSVKLLVNGKLCEAELNLDAPDLQVLPTTEISIERGSSIHVVITIK